MRVVVVASQKGGAGKSTLAAHFATLADAMAGKGKRPALLLDCDPQGSLAFWHSRRESPRPQLAQIAASDAPAVLDEARAAGVQWAIIDSPPHNAPAVNALMRLASLVVVPVRPAPFDLVAASVTIEAAQALGARAVAILNHAPPPSRHGEAATTVEARTVLEGFGAEVLAGQVSRRAALEHALINGSAVNEYEPDGRAAQEIAAAWRQIVARIEGRGKARKGS